MSRKSRSRSRSRRRTRKTHYGGQSSLVTNNVRKEVIKSRQNSSVKAKNALNKSFTAQGLANEANAKAAKAIEEEKQAIAEQEKTNQETKIELDKLTANLEQKRSEIESDIQREKNEKQRTMIAEQEKKQAELQRQLEEGQQQLQRNLVELNQKIKKAKMQSELQLQEKQKEITNTIAKQQKNAKEKRNAAEREKEQAINAAIQASDLANNAANEAARYAKTASEKRLLITNGSPSGTNISNRPRANSNGSQPATTASSGNSGSAVTNALKQYNKEAANRAREMIAVRRASNAAENAIVATEIAAAKEAAAKEAASKIVQQPPQAAVVQSSMNQSVKAPLPLKVQRRNLENSIKSIQGRLRRENRTLTNKNKQNLQSQLKSKQNQLLQLPK